MKKTVFVLLFLLPWMLVCTEQNTTRGPVKTFDSDKDLLSLHYDHASDRDDGQSAAADRTLLESLYGMDWIKQHVVPVSGAYGKNRDIFVSESDAVMDAAWNDCGGWLAAHDHQEAVISELTTRWSKTLTAGGDVWVKEGGQSDITAAVVERIREELSSVQTTKHIHVVQHSDWNEDQTTDEALSYTKKHAHYIRIRDANAYLNIQGGDDPFEKAATSHPVFGSIWNAAFSYYNPRERLDFSDTGELLYILGIGEIGFDAFRELFLEGIQ